MSSVQSSKLLNSDVHQTDKKFLHEHFAKQMFARRLQFRRWARAGYQCMSDLDTSNQVFIGQCRWESHGNSVSHHLLLTTKRRSQREKNGIMWGKFSSVGCHWDLFLSFAIFIIIKLSSFLSLQRNNFNNTNHWTSFVRYTVSVLSKILNCLFYFRLTDIRTSVSYEAKTDLRSVSGAEMTGQF